MVTKEMRDSLLARAVREQLEYISWLKSLSPAEILNHAHEYTIREDILRALSYMNMEEAEANALVSMPNVLSRIYDDYAELESDDPLHMETIELSIIHTAKMYNKEI